MTDYLYFLIKLRSDRHWQEPFTTTVEALRKVSVQEYGKVTYKHKQDVGSLTIRLNENYALKMPGRIGPLNTGPFFPKDAKLLPVESVKGKDLNSPSLLNYMDDIPLPATFVFQWNKGEVTAQKIEKMRHDHTMKLAWASDFLSEIISSVRVLIEEVQEDLKTSTSCEGKMPYPPRMSHLYLKHCQGREVQEDAATPRSDEVTDSDREQRARTMSKKKKKTGEDAEDSDGELEGRQLELSDQFVKQVKRIEKSKVLLEQSKKAHKAGKKTDDAYEESEDDF